MIKNYLWVKRLFLVGLLVSFLMPAFAYAGIKPPVGKGKPARTGAAKTHTKRSAHTKKRTATPTHSSAEYTHSTVSKTTAHTSPVSVSTRSSKAETVAGGSLTTSKTKQTILRQTARMSYTQQPGVVRY